MMLTEWGSSWTKVVRCLSIRARNLCEIRT